jgi:four helix bundle protein
MKNNIVQDKSFAFAIRIYCLYTFLKVEKKEYVLSKQLLRSGTSIGANIEEAIGGQTDKDFYAILSIAYKEARESRYWIKLLHATNLLNDEEAKSIMDDAEELCRIISKIQITMREKLAKK